MAQFVYYYKTPENERRSGEIEAPDRDAAFALLRDKGIRAIKVEPKGWETGKGYRGVSKRVVAACVASVAAVTGVIAFWSGSRSVVKPQKGEQILVSPQGPVTLSVAIPLERQRILGNRVRIENFPTNLFHHSAEILLARFAEPGRPLAKDLPRVSAEDVVACLKNPIRIASNELTEYSDLKRIVTGMKRELEAFLSEGGTVEAYQAELVKRQRMEIAYREKAEKRLLELLVPHPLGSSSSRQSVAYDYWLKANATLQTMGIYPLELPDALRQYQLTLDIDGVNYRGTHNL